MYLRNPCIYCLTFLREFRVHNTALIKEENMSQFWSILSWFFQFQFSCKVSLGSLTSLHFKLVNPRLAINNNAFDDCWGGVGIRLVLVCPRRLLCDCKWYLLISNNCILLNNTLMYIITSTFKNYVKSFSYNSSKYYITAVFP